MATRDIPRSTGEPAREYEITGVLGQGGFGTVYHAHMKASGGFSKEVAIKVLHDEDPDPEVLARFRDEARMLGMLRDRNIVSVDPPIMLGGRWAVVMEYVDGVSCHALLRDGGQLPARVALEITGEIARTLHNLWSFEDKDGKPLHLLHRDIKPSNIQITPQGQVKLLDFGVARADFEHREVHTTVSIAGTPGYIAPERLHGHEGPAGDIYSLGVVLHRLLTRRMPKAPTQEKMVMEEGLSALEQATWKLSEAMRQLNPANRPVALEVTQQCDELLRKWPGENLQTWAREEVERRPILKADALVGSILTQSVTFMRHEGIPTLSGRRRWLPLLAVPFLGFFGMLFAGVLSAVLVAYVLRPVPVEVQKTQRIEVPKPVIVEPSPPSEPAPVQPTAVAEPAPMKPKPPAPAPAHRTHVPPPSRQQVAPVPAPELAPSEPTEDTEPPPPTEPPPEPAMVSVIGEASMVELRSEGGAHPPGRVEPGTYEVWASFGDKTVQVGRVSLEPGQHISVRCVAAFKRCTIK